MSKVRITEYLDIDLTKEVWCCNRCNHELIDARDNYKKGCLVTEQKMEEVHPPMVEGETYSFMPDPDYCRLVEFYCPSCGTMLENEYLPPGHPLTHEIELDIDALKARHSKVESVVK
jgi:acetophenone carboxylase|tara:strand:- start:2733 stop:3083 length:351 start_codon:yes stop_codon:yes gene_type:complete